jgi:hypothetical protein
MKKLFLTGLVLGMVLFSSAAFADGWANYYVKASGPYYTTFAGIGQLTLIKLEPVAGGAATYFRLQADREKEFLAIALTGLSTGSPVRVYIQKLFSNNHWSDFVVTTMFIGETVSDLS